MTAKRMLFLGIALVVAIALFGWKQTSRGAYETAEYSVLKSDGPFEIREYQELMMATTGMVSGRRSDGDSFSRLFGYITGANEEKAKVAMTTPVFMEREASDTNGQMGFVIPKKVAEEGIPSPAREDVHIKKREGGTFAVIRFAGRIDGDSISDAEDRLRAWIDENALRSLGDVEIAGYDPPWTPGPLRRNELLLRLATD